jgi:hypothetical protein
MESMNAPAPNPASEQLDYLIGKTGVIENDDDPGRHGSLALSFCNGVCVMPKTGGGESKLLGK